MWRAPGRREAALLSVFWLACLLSCSTALSLAWSERLALQLYGSTAAGEVIATQHSPGVRAPARAVYRYAAVASGGNLGDYRATRPVSRPLASMLRVGVAVRVRYLPNQPERSDLEGNTYALLGNIYWSTAVLLPLDLFLALMFWLSVRELCHAQRP